MKVILSKVAAEDNTRKEIKFEEGIQRYKSLLLRVAKVQPFDILVSSEGTEQGNLHQNVVDLDVLERAHLVKGYAKETNHNVIVNMSSLLKELT